MSLLKSLLFPQPIIEPPNRRVDDGMGAKHPTYGTLKPRILGHLTTTGNADTIEIAEALSADRCQIHRALRELNKKSKVFVVKQGHGGGMSKVATIWRIA